MPNPDHLALLDQGHDIWNAWRKANPDLPPQLRSARLEGRDLRGFDLHDAYLRRARLKGARLDGCKLRDVFNTTTQRSVLILGRFGGGGLDVLRAVADSLRQQGLIPIIFDFERPRQRNYTETVITLAGLCSFIIVDLSGPSVPQELQAIVAATLRMPLVPIVEEGRNPAAMLANFQGLDYFLGPPIRFSSIPALVAQIPQQAVAPAQAWLAQRSNRLKTMDGR